MGASFLNVFEQGEPFDHGLIDAYQRYLVAIGCSAPRARAVMDTRQTCFSSYCVARAAFWCEWLAINEATFAICEGADSPLKAALTHTTSYGDGVQRKVSLMERSASLLLATQHQWRSATHDPFGFGWSVSRLPEHPHEVFVSDALKRAYRNTARPEYTQAFRAVRERLRRAAVTATGS
jgi:hypothetical protein